MTDRFEMILSPESMIFRRDPKTFRALGQNHVKSISYIDSFFDIEATCTYLLLRESLLIAT